MSTVANFTGAHLTAHIRRLSAEGSVLYVRIDSSDIARSGLRHGQGVEIDLGRDRVSGIVKTSGGSPWLAPEPGSSNASITAVLRRNGFEHGMDVRAGVRKLSADGDTLSTAVGLIRSRTPPRSVALQSGHTTPRFSDDWTEYVQQYNRGFYRGRRNIELDREAYSRFAKGLSRDMAELTNQITFVGKEYGGAQERFGDIRTEAALIAADVHPILEQWSKAVAEANPLVEGIPSQATLEYLFSPFRGTKRWPVWASKTLHFLRPDVFPILDSNAKKPLGLRNLVNSSFGYRQFCSSFRDFLLANTEKLATARTADSGESPTDLKLLDKILYQLGILMN